jgi:GT2 family glycosyltransferase
MNVTDRDRGSSNLAPARTPPFVSVIVPVFNQSEPLRACLRALNGQTYPRDRFEVIVVDNGSTDPVSVPTGSHSTVRVEGESKPGSYAARNRGVAIARGSVIAFTDADCVPAADWVERGVAAIERLDRAGMVGGRVDITLGDPRRPTAAELFETVLGFRQDKYIGSGFAATANVFTTRDTMASVGPFNDALMSGGDLEWGHRLRALGLAQVYDDDVRVSHAARHSLRQLCRKSVRVAGGLQQLARQSGGGTVDILTRGRQQLLLLGDVRANLRHEQLTTVRRKAKFAVAVWMFELVRVVERYRVHLGGTVWRT